VILRETPAYGGGAGRLRNGTGAVTFFAAYWPLQKATAYGGGCLLQLIAPRWGGSFRRKIVFLSPCRISCLIVLVPALLKFNFTLFLILAWRSWGAQICLQQILLLLLSGSLLRIL
jgi:hypothetical protein